MKNLLFLVILLSTACTTISTVTSHPIQSYTVTKCTECDGDVYILRFQFNVSDVSTTAQDRLGIKFLYAGRDSTVTMLISPTFDSNLAITTIANSIEQAYNNQK